MHSQSAEPVGDLPPSRDRDPVGDQSEQARVAVAAFPPALSPAKVNMPARLASTNPSPPGVNGIRPRREAVTNARSTTIEVSSTPSTTGSVRMQRHVIEPPLPQTGAGHPVPTSGQVRTDQIAGRHQTLGLIGAVAGTPTQPCGDGIDRPAERNQRCVVEQQESTHDRGGHEADPGRDRTVHEHGTDPNPGPTAPGRRAPAARTTRRSSAAWATVRPVPAVSASTPASFRSRYCTAVAVADPPGRTPAPPPPTTTATSPSAPTTSTAGRSRAGHPEAHQAGECARDHCHQRPVA